MVTDRSGQGSRRPDDHVDRRGSTARHRLRSSLRWHIERGDIVFPKSVSPERIKENIDIFDFELSGEDVEAISAFNRDERTGPDPDTFDMVPR